MLLARPAGLSTVVLFLQLLIAASKCKLAEKK